MSIAILDAQGRFVVHVPTVEDALLAFRRNPKAEIAKDETGRVVLLRPHRTRPDTDVRGTKQTSLFGHIPTPKARP